MQVARVEQKK